MQGPVLVVCLELGSSHLLTGEFQGGSSESGLKSFFPLLASHLLSPGPPEAGD